MDTSSINPVSVIDEAIDLSTRLAGTEFPVSIFPTQIQRIIHEVHECHNYPTDYIAAAILTAMAVGIGNTHLTQAGLDGESYPIYGIDWKTGSEQESSSQFRYETFP